MKVHLVNIHESIKRVIDSAHRNDRLIDHIELNPSEWNELSRHVEDLSRAVGDYARPLDSGKYNTYLGVEIRKGGFT